MTELDGVFSKGLEAISISASKEARERMLKFLEFLLERNKLMDLTAVININEAVPRHLIDSLTVLKAEELRGKKFIDVGCGAGFPGMPLMLYDPSFDITLLDSQLKRIDFLKEASLRFGVTPKLICARAEEASKDAKLRAAFDVAASRAVAPLSILCELSMPFLRTGGVFLAMKTKDSDEELKEAENAIRLLGGRVSGFYDYTLPGAGGEFRIIKIEKTSDTPAGYPRRFSRIKAKPL